MEPWDDGKQYVQVVDAGLRIFNGKGRFYSTGYLELPIRHYMVANGAAGLDIPLPITIKVVVVVEEEELPLYP